MNEIPTSETMDEPHWVSRSAFQIVVFLFLFTQIALFTVLKSGVSLWFAVPLVLLASHLMHGAAVGFHEATHGRLRPNRTFNEFDGVLIGTFSFLPPSAFIAPPISLIMPISRPSVMRNSGPLSFREHRVGPAFSRRCSNSPSAFSTPLFSSSALSSAKAHRFGIKKYADAFGSKRP